MTKLFNFVQNLPTTVSGCLEGRKKKVKRPEWANFFCKNNFVKVVAKTEKSREVRFVVVSVVVVVDVVVAVVVVVVAVVAVVSSSPPSSFESDVTTIQDETTPEVLGSKKVGGVEVIFFLSSAESSKGGGGTPTDDPDVFRGRKKVAFQKMAFLNWFCQFCIWTHSTRNIQVSPGLQVPQDLKVPQALHHH